MAQIHRTNQGTGLGKMSQEGHLACASTDNGCLKKRGEREDGAEGSSRLTQGPSHLIWVECQTGGRGSTQLVIEKTCPRCPTGCTFLGSSWLIKNLGIFT